MQARLRLRHYRSTVSLGLEDEIAYPKRIINHRISHPCSWQAPANAKYELV